jgi:hypothetical protein
VGSDRLVRRLSRALVVLAIITAIVNIAISYGLIVPFPTIPDGTSLVDRMGLLRASDTRLLPLIMIGSLASMGVFLIAAMLGVALRRYASGLGWRDAMAMLLVVGGILGITAQALNIGVANAATFGFCDCGFRNEELIAQDYALSVGWAAQNWLNLTALTILSVGVALAGRLIAISSTWRLISYAISALILVAVALRMIAAFVFVPVFDPFQVSDVLVALGAGILVPIWAILLSRGIASAPETMARPAIAAA